MIETDILVIGGGAAGMGAAVGAAREGVSVTVIERVEKSGGILNQCIHNGFGLHYFKEELTGPEFAYRLGSMMSEYDNINVIKNAFLHSVSVREKSVLIVTEYGVERIKTKAMVIATGARERPFGAILVPGTRPAGIYTAGVAQRFVNIENRLPGKKAVILGSGDIGLIMARRLTLEGMKVEAVIERMSYPGGLERNIRQCLNDFDIPLYLSHTVTKVEGKDRLESVFVSEVDEMYQPIPGTEKKFDVDTLILSVGLVPQSALFKDYVRTDRATKGIITSSSGRTSIPWIFAAGNCVVIYDLVDFVTREGNIAGKNAALYAKNEGEYVTFAVIKGKNVGILFPGNYEVGTDLNLYLRVKKPFDAAQIRVLQGYNVVYNKKHLHLSPSEMVEIKIPAAKLGFGDIHLEVD